MRTEARELSVCLALILGLSATIQGQEITLEQELTESQNRLEMVRERRMQLQEELQALNEEINNVSMRMVNLEQQMSVSRSVIDEMRFQLRTLSSQISEGQKELFHTKDQISLRSAVLSRRLRDIYKRGPLHGLRVMLSSESFPELLTKYKYLHLASYQDRSLLREVEILEQEIIDRTNHIKEEISRLSSLQYVGLQEAMTLTNIENIYRETLLNFREERNVTTGEIEGLTADENRIASLIENLESRRAERDRRATANAEERNFDPASIGTMDWPVQGNLIYNFGRNTRPDGNVLRWDGIGIQAEVGAPVYAAKGGTVALAGPFEGYGPTVVLSHGDGFYTLYLYLGDIRVTEGNNILQGEILGSVGGIETPEGPHIEFQVRMPTNDGRPEAQDPLQWLDPQ